MGSRKNAPKTSRRESLNPPFAVGAFDRLISRFVPDVVPDQPRDLGFWRERILALVLLVMTGLGTFAYGPSVFFAARFGLHHIVLLDTVVYAVLLGALLSRNAAYNVRAGAVLGISWLLTWVLLFDMGPFAAGPMWLFGSVVLAAVLLSARAVTISLACSFGTLVMFALAIQHRWASDSIWNAPHAFEIWIVIASNLFFLQCVVSLAISYVLTSLDESYRVARTLAEQRTFEQEVLRRTHEALQLQITERQWIEQERMLLSGVVEQTPSGLVITDRSGVIEYANPAFESLVGMHRSELVGTRLTALGVLGDSAVEREIAEHAERGRTWRGRVRARRQDGALLDLEVTLHPVQDRSRERRDSVFSFRDVQREIELEAHLRQSQRLEAIGTLAGGIAHDVNNLLVPILACARLLRDRLDQEEQRQLLGDVISAAERGRDLVRRILSFSRRTSTERTVIDIGPLVAEVAQLLRATLPSDIELRIDAASDTGAVRADPLEIHQIVLNLATNAVHAMRARRGVLTLSTSRGKSDDGSPAVVLEVADQGEGMDKGTMDRIFEPFFSTRERGEGTGLGLAMVHGIVVDLGGAIAVVSEPGKGSTFKVTLPEVAATRSGPTISAHSSARGRILVVDDEPMVRRAACRLLERLGCQTGSADSARAALEALEGQHYDVVMTDFDMPGATGLELAAAIRKSKPALPIVLVTGLVDANIHARAREHGIGVVVAKPYSLEDLAKALAATGAANVRG